MFALTNCTVYTGEEVLTNYAVLIENETIVDVVLQDDLPEAVFKIDLQGHDLVPGWVDLQLYGGKTGFLVRDLSEESLIDMVETHRRDGTIAIVPTLYSTTHERILKAIEVTKDYIGSGQPGVLGLHIEGPFINFTKRGAHSANAVRVPTKAEIAEIIAYAEGLTTVMTIAPEIWPEELLHLLQDSGIILSLGHTNATYQQAKNYFSGGIRLATHLYNAMRPFESREPGVVTAVWDTPTVSASIIVDGYHCDYATVRIAKQLMGERLFLISDATLAKIEPMRFEFEDFIANYDGHRLVNEEGKLAGSAITLLDAVRNCIHHVGIPKDEVFRMASLYPAQHLKAADRLGRIKAGYSADLVVLDEEQRVVKLIEER